MTCVEHDFDLTRAGHVRTRTGLIIGSAYHRPQAMTKDAEVIQSMLLDPPAPLLERFSHHLDRHVGKALAAMIALGLLYGLVERLVA